MVAPDSGSLGNVMTKPGKNPRLFYCKGFSFLERIVFDSSLRDLAGNPLLLAVDKAIGVHSTD